MSTAGVLVGGLTTTEVHQRAGVSYRQLDYWVRTGVVLPSVRMARGSGSPREWSARDADVVAVVARFARLGAQHEVLCWVAESAEELLRCGLDSAWLVVLPAGADRSGMN